MPTGAENVEAAWKLVDAATTELGKRVQALIDQINATAEEGLTGPQTEAVLAHLASLKTALDTMGANPANPVPKPAPVPAPLPGPFA